MTKYVYQHRLRGADLDRRCVSRRACQGVLLDSTNWLLHQYESGSWICEACWDKIMVDANAKAEERREMMRPFFKNTRRRS